MSTDRIRLPAAERRQAIVEAALKVFSSGSYAGATTAEIAREAGISEPILYRHFSSKRDLWFACLDAAWEEARVALEQVVHQLASAPDPANAALALEEGRDAEPLDPGSDRGGRGPRDPSARAHAHARGARLRGATLIRTRQADGGVPAERDADAEAWIFVAGGLLRSFADRLGGVLSDADLDAIGRERRRWLVGRRR